MRLTSRSRYAVTAMLDLALHGGDRPVCLAAIAARQQLSLAYLERLFRQLRQHGLVRSTRGAHGGYQLCLCAERISVAAVMAAVDETLDATACDGAENCRADGARCLSHELWADLTEHVHSYLSGVTLGELCARRARAADQPRPLYFQPRTVGPT